MQGTRHESSWACVQGHGWRPCNQRSSVCNQRSSAYNQRSSAYKGTVGVRAIRCHPCAIRGHQCAIRGHHSSAYKGTVGVRALARAQPPYPRRCGIFGVPIRDLMRKSACNQHAISMQSESQFESQFETVMKVGLAMEAGLMPFCCSWSSWNVSSDECCSPSAQDDASARDQ